MILRLALLDPDARYLEKMSTLFASKHAADAAVFTFTSLESALSSLSNQSIDVILAGDQFDLSKALLPSGCGLAYLVDSTDTLELRGKPCVCRFQRVERIYKTALEVYSKNVPEGMLRGGSEKAKIVSFLSPSGGTGVSAASAACAMHFGLKDQSSLFLSLDQFGMAESAFFGEGSKTLSDVLFALKSSKRESLPVLLPSMARLDESGTSFFASFETALDLAEMGKDDAALLIESLAGCGRYKHIITDLSLSLTPAALEIIRLSDACVFVLDGTEKSLRKLDRALEALSVLSERMKEHILKQPAAFYNMFPFGGMKSQVLRDLGEQIPISGIRRQIVEYMSAHPAFEGIWRDA
ncbi:MAG: hypothetical protein LBT59_19870 [Clostridiales bacterium]|jgi:cellulose biosynthesis protein BcsQ|nr:hypothetical protein [Clostridiales bacterium]